MPSLTALDQPKPKDHQARDLEVFGFSPNRTGGHMARSMMFGELKTLHELLPEDATREDFGRAIEEDNAIGKPTFSSRQKSFRHLLELYSLENKRALFRVLRKIGRDDPASLPLMAAVCTYCRDAQLRASFELLREKKPGEVIPRKEMEDQLEHKFPGAFSDAMKKSLAQNVNTTWTNCGHLEGRVKKTRTLPQARMGAVCYAMFAGWLRGLRGEFLLNSTFSALANVSPTAVASWLHQGGTAGQELDPMLADRPKTTGTLRLFLDPITKLPVRFESPTETKTYSYPSDVTPIDPPEHFKGAYESWRKEILTASRKPSKP